ncbi:MAG: hypothetical protein Ct9H300mP3_07840 [Gammaproteobacteria bacterium]|nr:MAG: hypothetical protein Ct9H300mP3_07840 [Gammaproteobacteria bacterium]
MKKAMLSVSDSLKKLKIDAKLILQVHDELVVESQEKDTEKVTKILMTLCQRQRSFQFH